MDGRAGLAGPSVPAQGRVSFLLPWLSLAPHGHSLPESLSLATESPCFQEKLGSCVVLDYQGHLSLMGQNLSQDEL